MESNYKFVTLEMACRALKQQDVRLLKEVALELSSVVSPEAEFNPDTIRFADSESQYSSPPITYGRIASYFQVATGKYVPVLFETAEYTVESSRVLVNKEWLERRIAHARDVLGLTALVSEPTANQVVAKAQIANSSALNFDQPLPLTSDALENLRLMLGQQNSQRKAQDAAGRETLARQAAEERANRAEALLLVRDRQIESLIEEIESLTRDLNAERRLRVESQGDATRIEEQLELAMAFAECLRIDNPLSPPEMRLAFQCWNELTHGGTFNPAGPGGRGIHGLAEQWAKANGHQLNKDAMERFKATLSWRKRGAGAIRSR